MIIGSLNLSRYSFHNDSFSGGGMMFLPIPLLTFSESFERLDCRYELFLRI